MIYAATGHRPDKLGGYGLPVTEALTALARTFLEGLGDGPKCPSRVITGMALGWDQAWAAAAAELGIPYVAAVPFQGQEKAWPEGAQRRYETILRGAAEVVTVLPGGYAPYKMQVRNEWMVDHADHVVALWDGSTGGTANCVAYAKKAGKPITNLWPQWRGAR